MPFRDVIGHRRLVALLSRSAERGSVPPSLIFAGPSGVGKRLVALSTAQALNCLEPRRTSPPSSSATDHLGYDACGKCAACTRIARQIHPDVIFIEPDDKGSIKIEVVRDVVARVGYRPFEGRRRVVVIDEADAMAASPQNALLKTLEEPPPSSMIILVTSRPDALLPTVLSRCPRLRFRALGPDDVAAALVERGKTESQARAIAATADGSIGQALQASAEELLEARDVALRVLVNAAQTDDPRRRVESAPAMLPDKNKSRGGAADREHLAMHLRAMASLLRDAELLAVDADRGALANPDVLSGLDRLSPFQGDRGVRAFEAVDKALVALDRNASVKVVADWVSLQL